MISLSVQKTLHLEYREGDRWEGPMRDLAEAQESLAWIRAHSFSFPELFLPLPVRKASQVSRQFLPSAQI